ncbi:MULTISPECIES: PP2C family serine/threonine-protein phosphatase [unclassified Arthrobacter]|uniref:PP2C family protein-serine/threonine phosphatase n=1 Tax=unclassified Arthrobacter TaxID=235627 RepID=UPI001E380451|nr:MULTISPECIES: PP2C family serine/threonine-protein phosphatase [unclassified Arthrobacter]MCC9144245.1 protein phosphatase 2C domain-containing protein [Arthrobacter sp. zg-Y919]MDK1275470.1 protein phosphatase 2C domain-containing protein [Arthrobacter sp. zg.Y919]WIB03151.1 protein phosphatase 2C domain-containing protein [Arthrobacter sp. zg-Y919]
MVRFKNDDSAYVGRYLAVVADGMGGHAGGNVASASTVLDLVHLDSDSHEDEPLTILADEIQAANSLLSELVTTSPQLSGMGTTVTALLLHDQRLALAHIGDSRAYRLKDGRFEQISIDHTFVQRLIDEGRLQPEEAEVHPHKNVLMRVLGDVDASPELDLASFEVEPGERWLLCSDGLTAVLRDSDIEGVLRGSSDLQECVDTLVELTLAGGSPDNVTVAVIEIAEDTNAGSGPATAQFPCQGSGSRDAAVAAAAPPVVDDAPDTATTPETANGTDAGDDADDDESERERAALIRQDLASRPHVLVGAAALATETGEIPIVTKRSAERRAARMLTHKADTGQAAEQQTGDSPRPAWKRWLLPAFLTVVALLLAVAVWLGYTWTQTRYYVGSYDNRVAIFNGVSQTLGPIHLSHVTDVSDIPVDSLSEYHRNRVEDTLPARDLEHAGKIVTELRDTAKAVLCPPADSGSGTDSGGASPSAAANSACGGVQ